MPSKTRSLSTNAPMNYLSDRLYEKVSGVVGDTALSAGIPLLTSVAPQGLASLLAAAMTPEVWAKDEEGRKLVHMDRTARKAVDRGALLGGLSTAGLMRHRILANHGYFSAVGQYPTALGALAGIAVGSALGGITAGAMNRNKTRALHEHYYRDPGKPLSGGAVLLPAPSPL